MNKEDTECFTWFFDTYAKMVGKDNLPQACFTDRDAAATAAMSLSWPGTAHYCCQWHMDQNLRKNLLSSLRPENFKVSSKNCRVEYL
jgi:hypothetical protein